MIEIPKQLQKEEFRFVKLLKKEKKPFEDKWQSKKNYKYNDKELLDWISQDGNYGCIGGYGNLRIIDCDKNEFTQEILKYIPNTLTILTGNKGTHFYILSDYSKNHVFNNENGELRSDRYQVVGANCIHPNGNKYQIINDSEIAYIPANKLREIIEPYIKSEYSTINLDKIKDETRSGKEYKEVIRLIGNGLTREQIFKEMTLFSKWSTAHPSYRELTYKKAFEYINSEKTKENSKKFRTKDAIQKFDYLNMADEFIKTQPLYYDKNMMWWIWNFQDNAWEITDEVDIMNIIDDNLNIIGTVESNIKSQIIESLKRRARLNKPKDIQNTWIQFKNKIIDISDGKEYQVSSKFFNVNPIPWELGESEETPNLDRIFEEWVGKDYKQTLYEIVAFSLFPIYFIHRIFCFVGSGLNGKSKFFGLLKNLIGEKNCTSTGLSTLLNSRFESAKLYKKLVCIMGETNFNILDKTDIIKRLTGQDLIGFEFKGKKPFDDFNYAKILIATNTLPTTLDKTTGFYRRWLIIDFPNKFDEKKDILNDIPEQEYKNLCKKSINILKEIWVKREFTNEGTIEERAKKYEEKSNPLNQFIKENYIRNLNEKVPFFEFYDLYEAFLKERGYRLQSKIEVGKLLLNEGFDKKKFNIKQENGEMSTRWFVVGLAPNNTNITNNTIFSLNSLYRENKWEIVDNGNIGIIPQKIEEVDMNKSRFKECQKCGLKKPEAIDEYGICEICKM